MEHPFFTTTNTRAEALRWLTIAEKLLSARDLMGSKSFASRARDSDPTLSQADQILAVADTLLAGDSRVGNNQHDWYSILRLTQPQGGDSELVATQYRKLALLLNPQQNRLPFAEQAFRLVVDAWSVLSNPPRKIVYDRELDFYRRERQKPHQSDPFGNPVPTMPQNFMFFGGSPAGGGVAQPHVHVGSSSGGGVPSQFAQAHQVHSQSQVEPMGGGSTREPQNFLSFTSGSNIMFASGSRSSSSPENVNKPSQDTFPGFGGSCSMPSSYGANHEQVNTTTTTTTTTPNNNSNKQKQPADNHSNASHKTSHDVNIGENVGDITEDEEDLERMDVQEEERVVEPVNERRGVTFWTACPYCYYMYEYPNMYADCTLKCQNCKRAYQAVVIPSPPLIVNGQEYFCCWGFVPMGFSMENWEKNRAAAAAWTPFSPMFTLPKIGNTSNVDRKVSARKSMVPRVYVDDDEDEVFVEFSDSGDSDDDDWQNDERKKKKAKNVRVSGGTPSKNRKRTRVDKAKNVGVQYDIASSVRVEVANKTSSEPSAKSITLNQVTGELSTKDAAPNMTTGDQGKKVVGPSARKQPGRIAKNFGKLDLNVECSNEAEEPALRMNAGNAAGRGEDDNIGFFEGLDEFLSSLPILNVVGDDKAVKAS